MRRRWLVIGGVVGAILGAVVAAIGATQISVCSDPGVGIVSCAEPDILLAILWGVAIGSVVGLLTGFVVPRRQELER